MNLVSDPLEAALRSLPHGPEFRFIDHLTRLTPGVEGAGEYRVRGDEPFLKGHFPGNPLIPGVLLIEAAAQLAGIVAQTDPQIASLQNLKLAALRQVKILGSARPGETLTIHARVIGRLGPMVQAEASCLVAGREVLRAEISLSGTR